MKLHFRKYGTGPAVILLHGLLGSLDNWQPVARRLADAFTVFALDLRNHGRSPHSAEMSLETLRSDVEEFVRDLGPARVHLVGHSLGGRVAMRVALDRPELVERLVVADISPGPPDPARKASLLTTLAAMRALPVRSARTREELDAALARDVPDAAVRAFLLKNLARDPAGGFRWKVNLEALRANADQLAVAVHAQAPCLRPTLFLRGERSDFLPPEHEPLIRRLFPKAEIHTIPGAGHWLQTEQPDVVAARIAEFLQRRNAD